MTQAVAIFPMYDWPEIRPATDAFWAALRDGFRDVGISAPEDLDRSTTLSDALGNATLLVGQTCGLPYVQGLSTQCVLLGAPDYGVAGCEPGEYRSVVVVRNDDQRETLKDFKGSRFAMNSPGSQSGCGAMLHELAPLANGKPYFAEVLKSGGHAASIELVTSGAADIAAIDCLTWRLAKQFLPKTSKLRELCLTAPSPGLPLVTSIDRDPELMRKTIGNVLRELDGSVADQLGIVGFREYFPEDYSVVAHRFDRACKSLNWHPC